MTSSRAQPVVAAEAFAIEINGQRRAADKTGWPVTPGRRNILEVGVRDQGMKLPLTVTLVDQIQLDPLEDCGWRGEPHDVRAYLELGRRFGVPVLGGINGNTFWNYPALLRRALGLMQAGVAGIEIYESTNFSSVAPVRWLIPLVGHAARTRAFLDESNLEACHPIYARNACAGYDNHSFRGNWSVYGLGPNSL